MDEKRKYFRVRNNGEIEAYFNGVLLNVIDISAASVAIAQSIDLPAKGTILLKINNFSINADFEYLRTLDEVTILLFQNENQINSLLPVLKRFRAQHL